MRCDAMRWVHMHSMFLPGTDFWRYLDTAYNSVPGSGGSNPLHAIPCVHGLTCTPHSSTIITGLTSLLTLRTDPPDKLISKARLDTSRIIAHLHTHTVQWLHHLLLVYRIKSRTTTRRANAHCTYARPYLHAATTMHRILPGEEVKTYNTLWRCWIKQLTV
jgi:hypothetical protein